jgi:hypothetical protein
MKTKVKFNHQLLMGLLVLGSVFSMIISSAFTTSSAFTASLAQPANKVGTILSSITPGSLGIEAKKKGDGDHDADDKTQKESDEDSNQTPAVTELSGQLSGLVVTPTRASFAVGGSGARMDANLINGFSFSNGDWVTVEGYYLGANNTGTFLVTEIDKVP